MLIKIYPLLLNIFFISNITLWDFYGGFFQLKILIISLPFIYFFLNKSKNYSLLSDYFNFHISLENKKIIIWLIIFLLLFSFHKIININNFIFRNELYSLIKIPILFLTIYSVYFNFNLIKKNFEKIIYYSIIFILFLYCLEIIINFDNEFLSIRKFAFVNNCYDGFFRENSIIFMEESHYGMIVPGLIISYLTILFKKKKSLKYFLPVLIILILTLMLSLSLTFIFGICFGLFIAFIFSKGVKEKFIYFLIFVIFSSSILIFPRCTKKTSVILVSFIEKVPQVCNISEDLNLCDLVKDIYFKAKFRENLNYEIIKLQETVEYVDEINNQSKSPLFHEFLVNKTYQNDKSIDEEKEMTILSDYNGPGEKKISDIESSLSQAVYTNSFKILTRSLEYNKWGAGFDNYNLIFNKFIEATSKNITKDKDVNKDVKILNINDASNNFVKLTVEFGIFIIPFFILIFVFSINRMVPVELKVFVLVLLMTQLFLRGAGYFNGGFLICISIMIFSLFSKKKYEKNNL